MQTLDLNCDMGELKAGQARNYDAAIMPFISSCNIACGFHSGDPLLMEETIRAALTHRVAIGAHPSYNDRANFGRKSLQVALPTLIAELRYQISALKGMVESLGGRLNHVKPHGALYNDMAKDENLADHFVRLVKSIDPKLKIFCLAHSLVIDCCKQQGMQAVSEGFADRRYQVVNALRSRKFEDAVIHEPSQVLAQIQNFLKGKVQLIDYTTADIHVETICLHSDTLGAVNLSKSIHQFLTKHHVRISAIV